MVLQETWLKAGTIRENICYGKPDATEEEMIMAAKKPMHMDLSSQMPDGYDDHYRRWRKSLSRTETAPFVPQRTMPSLPPTPILDDDIIN